MAGECGGAGVGPEKFVPAPVPNPARKDLKDARIEKLEEVAEGLWRRIAELEARLAKAASKKR